MRIGIDARFLTHPQRGGFKTYTECLVQALADVDRENTYMLYVDRTPRATDVLPSQPNFTCKVVPGSLTNYGMLWREQISLPRQVDRDHLDVFHAPCLTAPLFLKTPTIVTIHDMIWSYPTRYTTRKIQFNRRRLFEWYYQFVPYIAARNAEAVLTVSEASKKSILEYLKLDSKKIFVIYEAAKEIYRPIRQADLVEKTVQRYGLTNRYILGIGSADPRKNIKTLIDAYARLPKNLMKDNHLAIVWNHKSLESDSFLEAQRLNVSEYVHFLDNVPDKDLVSLYNRASMFVFPSLEEGFGLPPLEAMACGTPVLAANNSSMPEIVGDAAKMFSAQSVQELAELIKCVLEKPELQETMRSRGMERSANFSWKKCALETIDVYRQLHSQ